MVIREGDVKNYYVDMTQRKTSIRYKEHVSDVKYNRGNTALSGLSKKDNININFKLINRCNWYNLLYKLIYRFNFYLRLFIGNQLKYIRFKNM